MDEKTLNEQADNAKTAKPVKEVPYKRGMVADLLYELSKKQPTENAG